MTDDRSEKSRMGKGRQYSTDPEGMEETVNKEARRRKADESGRIGGRKRNRTAVPYCGKR